MRFCDRNGHALPLSIVFGNHLADVRRRQDQRETAARKLRLAQTVGTVTSRVGVDTKSWLGEPPSGIRLQHCVDDSVNGDNGIAPKD